MLNPNDHLLMIVLSMKNTVKINFFMLYSPLQVRHIYQALHLERNPMYVFLNLKFMYQIAGAVLSLLICGRF